MKTTLVGLLLFAVSLPSARAAMSPADEYAMQERCGRRAAEVFEKKFGKSGVVNTPDGQATASYRNHYNSEMNKCFILITYLDQPFKKDNTSTSMTLYDVNEFKVYARYSKLDSAATPDECGAGTKACSSREEWARLVAPFMGD